MTKNLDDLLKLLPEAGILAAPADKYVYRVHDWHATFNVDTYAGRLALAAYCGAVCDILYDAHKDIFYDKSGEEERYWADAAYGFYNLKSDFYAWAEQEEWG